MLFVTKPKCLCIISKNVRINTKEFDELFFLIQNQTLVSAHPPKLVKDYFKNSQGKISLEKIILREILCFATTNWERRQVGARDQDINIGRVVKRISAALVWRACQPGRNKEKQLVELSWSFTLYNNLGNRHSKPSYTET